MPADPIEMSGRFAAWLASLDGLPPSPGVQALTISASDAAPRASVRCIRIGYLLHSDGRAQARRRPMSGKSTAGLLTVPVTYTGDVDGSGSVAAGSRNRDPRPAVPASGRCAPAEPGRDGAPLDHREDQLGADGQDRHQDRGADDAVEVAREDALDDEVRRGSRPPTIAASVAVATIWTAEIRMPARMTGSATGTSTRRTSSAARHPHPAAAPRRMSASTPRIPA